MHIRGRQHDIAQRRGLETVAVLFVLRHGKTSVVTIRQPCAPIIEIIILSQKVLADSNNNIKKGSYQALY